MIYTTETAMEKAEEAVNVVHGLDLVRIADDEVQAVAAALLEAQAEALTEVQGAIMFDALARGYARELAARLRKEAAALREG